MRATFGVPSAYTEARWDGMEGTDILLYSRVDVLLDALSVKYVSALGLDGILGEILIGKLRITSISVNTTKDSGEHTGKMHRVCM